MQAQARLLLVAAAAAASLAVGWSPVGAGVSNATATATAPSFADWSRYGGEGGRRFSALNQITPGNVAQLRAAWRHDTGEGELQTHPLVVGGVVFAYTPKLNVLALDGATGRPLWTFDPGIEGSQPSRGLSYWTDGRRNVLFAGVMNRLYALDPATGRPVQGFGKNGFVDLREGLGRDPEKQAVFLTTPGVVWRDLIIVGFRTGEGKPAAPGDIRAYDVRTGQLRWAFHTLPAAGEPGRETWSNDPRKDSGAANNWAGMVVDEQRGIVFAPTGSAVDDFYGGDRLGDNLYANTLLALDARTGKRLWHFQAVRHDVWDRDFPSPPVLLTVERGGKRIDAVAQATKQGYLFVFDRVTGEPLFPIEERPAPASTVPGEKTAPTQPAPVRPAPFARQQLTEAMLTRRTPEAHRWAVEEFRKMQSGPAFTPFRLDKQTVVFPGFDGGAEWGGQAVDRRGVMYVNSNDLPWMGGLRDDASPGDAPKGPGAQVYAAQCAACHGEDRAGSPPAFPSLLGVGQRLSEGEIARIVRNGKGRMPGFPGLTDAQVTALTAYLEGKETVQSDRREVAGAPGASRYSFTGYKKFLDPDGYPAVEPPWGTLNAIDLNTGEHLWRIPFGEHPELLAKHGITGSENYGGPIVTDTGLLFIGATLYDSKFRAFEARTGRLLWQTKLPYAGMATPVTYMAGGRQYVLIATSGARNKKGPQGSAYVAFALPK